MAIAPRIDAIESNIGQYTALPTIAAPFTTIQNRALMTNLANDLGARVGPERIMTQRLVDLSGESGTNGGRVFTITNDIHNQIRFVGNCTTILSDKGPIVSLQDTTAYAEISFYGTGLNILTMQDGNTRTVDVSTDGGSVTNVSLTGASVLASRNYNTNQIVSLMTGSLAFRTVKVAYSSGSAIQISGFEILNDSTTMKIAPGSIIGSYTSVLASLQSKAFDKTAVLESGVLSTRGGRLISYIKNDGTVGMAGQPANASSSFLTAITPTVRSTEEVIGITNFREYGSGRADDFSYATVGGGAVAKAFTLDDGGSSLVCPSSAFSSEYFGPDNTVGHTLFITFFGSGLDVLRKDNASGGNGPTLYVDGTNVGSLATPVSGLERIEKLCAGLPVGWHTVGLANNNGSVITTYRNFIAYAPKTPSVPANATQNAAWYVNADYAISSSSLNGFISTGVVRKMGTREVVYSGTWVSPTIDASVNSGWSIRSSTSGAYAELVFWGTGIEWRGSQVNGQAWNVSVTVDSLALNAGSNVGSTVSLLTTGGSGLSISAAGVITGTAVTTTKIATRVSGLALGKHTIRVTLNASSADVYVDCFDIITPVYSPVANGPGCLQNAYFVGSNAIASTRKFSPTAVAGRKPRNWSRALGVNSSPTTGVATLTPIPDMTCPIDCQTGLLLVEATQTFVNSSAAQITGFAIYMDGVQVAPTSGQYRAQRDAVSASVFHISERIPASIGRHLIQVIWYASGGTSTATAVERNLDVTDIG